MNNFSNTLFPLICASSTMYCCGLCIYMNRLIPYHTPFSIFLLASEKLFMEMADRIAEDGFKDVGYEFVNIDVSL